MDMEIASWFPWGVDYQPVSINHLYNAQLISIATRCLAFDSEFLFMTSPRMGCVGSLMRDNFFNSNVGTVLHLGFMMILGYSSRMEQLVDTALDELKRDEHEALAAGVAFCSLWNRRLLMGSIKVIALVSEELFFDETNFLNRFEKLLAASMQEPEEDCDLPFFAERFGYRRFCVPYETDDLLQLRISQLLYEMEFAETRQMVGPSPEVPFPPMLGIALNELGGDKGIEDG